ncbi:MAG: NUDIX domain-containing protein [Actinobacteria bacterium]|nr:MAG: NUDIX domain-containing protein [Actinomycetota bacterium]
MLDGWRVCPRCGTDLERREGSVHCPACGFVHYASPAPAVCALIVDDEGRVLLARRAHEPKAGLWDLVGGFLEEHEQPLDALQREAREETGLDVQPLEFVGAVTDRYGDDGHATLNLAWTARPLGGEPEPADDVAELRWFARDALPPRGEFAFENSVVLLDTWRG